MPKNTMNLTQEEIDRKRAAIKRFLANVKVREPRDSRKQSGPPNSGSQKTSP